MATKSWIEWILSFLPDLPRRKRPRDGRRRSVSVRIKISPKHDGYKVVIGRITKFNSPPRSTKDPGNYRNPSRQSSPIKTSRQGPHLRTSPSPKQSITASSPAGSPVKRTASHTSTRVEQGLELITATQEGHLLPGSPEAPSRPKPSITQLSEEKQPGEDPGRTNVPAEGAPEANSPASQSDPPTPENAWNKWLTVEAPKTKGLANPRNYCYRNATLQALFHVPGFYRYMANIHEVCYVTNKICVLCALKKLLYVYWNDADLPSRKRGYAPCPLDELAAFNQSCNDNLSNIETGEDLRIEFLEELQAYAYDFIMYLLDQIEQRLEDEERDLFAEMFEMRQQETWTCDNCGIQRTRPITLEEARTGLDIAIRPRAPGDTLVKYLQEEFKEQSRAQKCDSKTCKRKSKLQVKDGPTRQVTKRIITAPQILTIRLKRFLQTRNGKRPRFDNVKIDDPVEFEEFLDLSDFTHTDGGCTYRLDGVVGHTGAGVRGGHYFSAVRVNQPDTKKAQFQIVNDDTVVGKTQRYQGSFNEMKDPTSRQQQTASPYIPVYSKISSPQNI